MPYHTPNSTPTDLDSIKNAANKAPGSTLDFLASYADLGLGYRLSRHQLYINPAFGLRLAQSMTAPACVGIALPAGTSIGHLFATLLACPIPALVLYHMRTVGSDEAETVDWKEAYDSAGQKFIDALERFDSRKLQGMIAGWIEEAALPGSDNELDGDGKADAGAVTSDVTGRAGE